jgi:hypothetical protein
MSKDEFDRFDEQMYKNFLQFLLSNRSDHGPVVGIAMTFPDLTRPKSSGLDRIRIHHTLILNVFLYLWCEVMY